MAFYMPVSAYAVFFAGTGQWASSKHHYERLFPIQMYTLIGRKNQVKFENYYVARNGHKSKLLYQIQ